MPQIDLPVALCALRITFYRKTGSSILLLHTHSSFSDKPHRLQSFCFLFFISGFGTSFAYSAVQKSLVKILCEISVKFKFHHYQNCKYGKFRKCFLLSTMSRTSLVMLSVLLTRIISPFSSILNIIIFNIGRFYISS